MPMELRVLKYFLVVAQEGNITGAAARLHVGQPTLSRQLKELEQELGQQLFVRQSHGITLTEAGHQLRVYAKEMVAISDKIERDFALMATRPMGDIYIGGIDGYLAEGAHVARLAQDRCINAVVRYTSCSSSDALVLLDRGLVDLAIVSQAVNVERYETLVFTSNCHWVALMRNDHPLATKATIEAADLRQQPLLMYEQITKTQHVNNTLADWFGEGFWELNVVATSNLTTALVAFVREGLGILPTWERIASLMGPDLVTVPLAPELMAQGILAWRKDRPLSQAASCYLSLIREVVSES